jgi:hypothetical protein
MSSHNMLFSIIHRVNIDNIHVDRYRDRI